MTKGDWIAVMAVSFFTLAGIYGLYLRHAAAKLRESRLAFLKDILTAVGELGHQDSEDIRRDKVGAIADQLNNCALFTEYPPYESYETFSTELHEHLQTLIQASSENDFTTLHEQAKDMSEKFEEAFAEEVII